MKTIVSRPAGRYWLAVAFFFSLNIYLVAQTLTTTPVQGQPNKFAFSVTLPDLPFLVGSPVFPYYELFVHYGDGNFERVLVYKNGNTSSGFTYPTWQKEYTYASADNFNPTVSLTGKYTPPEEPPKEFIGPAGNNNTGSSAPGTYTMSGSLRKPGRDIGIDTSHQIPWKSGRQTTLALGWTRSPNLPGGSVAVFFNGTRRISDGVLEATDPIATQNGSIMTLEAENRPHLNFSDPGKRRLVNGDPEFGALTGKYDSVIVLNNLTNTGNLSEGRNFLCFKNKKDLSFSDKKVSILVLYITKEPLRSVDSLNLLDPDGFGKIKQFDLPTGPNGSLAIGGGYLYDWYFYEERPVYVHDPNELIITSMSKRPTGDVIDMKFDFISCSDYKGNTTVQSAEVVFDRTILQSAPVLIGAEQPGRMLKIEPTAPASYKITKLALEPGGCFTMHLTGVLDAALEEQVLFDGKILHGCVRLAGEVSNDPNELCAANLKYDELRPVPPPTLCGQPGFWNKIKCLCAQSPIPCWILVIIALILLLWLFFKKKN